jgi:hypothetical protein
MQELWDYIDANYHEKGFNLYNAKEISLEKEKEQIIDAYYGNIDGVFGYREEGQEYYNQTYNQKEETLEEWKSKFTHHCAVKNNQNP